MPNEKRRQIAEAWKHLWTTEHDKYILVKDDEAPVAGYSIHRIPEGLSLIIEDDEEYRVVVEHMLKANIQIMDVRDYVKKYFPRP